VFDVCPNNSAKRRTPLDARLAELAERQHGVVTTTQLHALGISRTEIGYRVQSGRLHPLHRGVYAVGHRHLSDEGSFVAAVLAVGPDAALSHAAAAALWGLRPVIGRPIDVTVPRRVRQRRGIWVHHVRALPPTDITHRSGIPTTTPARTLLDLADLLPHRALERAVHEAEVQRIVDHPLLRAQIERASGRQAATTLAAIINPGPAPTRSELEDRALALFRGHGLPEPLINPTIQGIEVDFLFREARLVVEVDGDRHHRTPFARRNDADKQARLEVAGYRVLRLTWTQVTRHPQQTVARLRRALTAPVAGSAPRAPPPPSALHTRLAPRP
jgi:Transcriptional regulator, AbiEi antitoxin/REase_MTES_1575